MSINASDYFATDKSKAHVLTADLTATELAEALAALRFQGGSLCLVSIDRDVRDFLLRAIKP